MIYNGTQKTPLSVLFADDDEDDRFLFVKALKEIPLLTQLNTVNDGEELMNFFAENSDYLPDILFLDLSMPRKTGIECLFAIKNDERLKQIPVVMFSTSSRRDFDLEMTYVSSLAKLGLQAYIRKPRDFELFKKVIHDTLNKVLIKNKITK